MGPITNPKVAADVNAARAQRVNFLQKFFRINNYAVTNDTRLVAVEDARRNEMERVAFIAHLHGVTSIGATVVADDHIMLRGEQVNDLSFTFVPPLQSNNGGMNSSIGALSSGHGRGSGANVRQLPREREW
jgi:hypothetical protein